MKPFLLSFPGLLLAACLVLTATHAWADEGRYGQQKAAYDVNYDGGKDARAYFKVLTNVRNHVQAVGESNIQVKVVLSGDGLNMLSLANTHLRLQGAIAALKLQKVAFLVCNNTLEGRKIDPNSLFEVFPQDIVPSGNAELAHLQGQGYAYLKP